MIIQSALHTHSRKSITFPGFGALGWFLVFFLIFWLRLITEGGCCVQVLIIAAIARLLLGFFFFFLAFSTECLLQLVQCHWCLPQLFFYYQSLSISYLQQTIKIPYFILLNTKIGKSCHISPRQISLSSL